MSIKLKERFILLILILSPFFIGNSIFAESISIPAVAKPTPVIVPKVSQPEPVVISKVITPEPVKPPEPVKNPTITEKIQVVVIKAVDYISEISKQIFFEIFPKTPPVRIKPANKTESIFKITPIRITPIGRPTPVRF